MNIGFYQAVSGMTSNWEYQTTLSSNLARLNVPGARGEINSFSSYLPTGEKYGNALSGPPVQTNRHFDFQQGTIQMSDNPYHFAIMGESFFRIQEADGAESFTRNGQFNKNPDGSLSTTDGALVLNNNGTPLTLPNTGEFTVDDYGNVLIDGRTADMMGLANFNNPVEDLRLSRFGRFKANNAVEPNLNMPLNDRVYQGKLEASNIQAIDQMVTMIEISRAFEANQKLIRAEDDARGQLLDILN
ncbi:MAG: flagellar hook basal-body protein [Verrucomicrobiota bacterium]